MNIPLLTTPLSVRPVSLSFGIAKIEFFSHIRTMQLTFFKFFCIFFITNYVSMK
jgi:hypothetical protein